MMMRIPPFALLVFALPAVAQDGYTLDVDGNIVFGTVATEVYAGDVVKNVAGAYGVPLAPGEEIIGLYAAPSVVWMPVEAEILYETSPYAPPAEIDQVTGLPRNTPGWTGESDEPLGIGCFPQGVCADLND